MGGDLNSKKSWHPSTLKNQERVWKAEQVAAEEKKRIVELQQERAQERDRHELNELARKNAINSSDNRLDWMYNKPDKQVQQEEYLLGKAVDKNFERSGKPDQNDIPAVARRVVGSSMISGESDVQVDLARKIREDPLLLVKERERAARAALLNNPVQRKKLTELLRKEQEQKKVEKEKKNHKKKDKDLDNMLAAKLNALSSNKVDLVKLLQSDNSSDEDTSDSESKKKKKKKKSKKKSKKVEKLRKKYKHEKEESLKHKTDTRYKHKPSSESDNESINENQRYSKKHRSSSSENETNVNKKYKNNFYDTPSSDQYLDKHVYKRYYEHDDGSQRIKRTKREKESSEEIGNRHKQEARYNDQEKRVRSDYDYKSRSSNIDRSNEKSNSNVRMKTTKKSGLSDKEKAARLEEMAAAGAEREIQRGRRVAEQIAENSAADKISSSRISSRNEARVLPDSLASRIHSNRHYIQRNERHMNEHFARR